jgi:hypothetical protein
LLIYSRAASYRGSLNMNSTWQHGKMNRRKHNNNNNNNNKLRGFSPRSNYTDRVTAACRRSSCQRFADRGVLHSQRGRSPTAVISVF